MKSSPGDSRCRWILDDGPFNDLSLTGFAKAIKKIEYPARRLLIAGATAHAAESSPPRKALLGTRTVAGEPLIEVIKIEIGGQDPVAAILLELHGEERTNTDLAEREAVAWSLVHGEDSVFVTYDIRAAMMALAELGTGRVAHPFDLWIDLLRDGALDPQGFEKLCDRSMARGSRLQRMPGRVKRLFPGRAAP